MRLTLRTLLAYLDDILEPTQAKEIGEKIQESPLASSLVHKIRDVVRRRRIGAPDVSGPRSEPDANVVAEYLDNTLPAEAVAEFERICLASDQCLAEVAATHQVLTLVLGESVEIPAEMRKRMYALGAVAPPPDLSEENGRSEPIPKISGVGAVVADRNAQSSSREDFASRLPDQLRRKPGWKRALPYVLGALILAGWGYMMVTDYIATDDDLVAQNGQHAHEVDLSRAAVGDFGGRAEPSEHPSGRRPTDQSMPNVQRAVNPQSASFRDSVARGTSPLDGVPSEEPIEVPMQEETDPFVAIPPPPSEPRLDAEDVAPPPPLPESVTEGPHDESELAHGRDALAATEAADVAPEADPVAPPPAALEPQPPLPNPFEVQYVNADGILLHHDSAADLWTVMPRRSLIFVGEEVASPLPFDSRLTVTDNALVGEVILRGGTRVRLMEPTAESRFGLEIDRGRILIIRRETETAARSLPLRLQIRDDLWLCELLEPQTVLGVEVVPVPPHGVGDLTGRSEYTGGLTLISGSARLTDTATQQVVELHPARGSVAFSASPKAAGLTVDETTSRPDWMLDVAMTAPLVRQVATKFEREFLPDQPISHSIRPVVKDRQPRISELATQTLALTDRLPGLVDALGAPHEESRIAAIEGIRAWLPRDEQIGPRLQEELQNRFRQDEAAALYLLLWGYSPTDARNAFTSAELVDGMANDEVAIRELAAYHVHKLTGRNLGYRADRRPEEREAVVRRWRDHLQDTGALLSD